MRRRKGTLSHRKNEQSFYHKQRAEERAARRSEAAKTYSAVVEENTPSEILLDFKGFNDPPLRKGGLRVLSLFDGLATTLFALDSMHLHVEAYFSSEIDPNALQLQRHRYGDRITRLGSVQSVTEDVLVSLGTIHLIVGGSPCTELSLVNWRRKGLKDPSSSGALFYEFVRIRNFLAQRATAAGEELYWLYENTFHMEVCNRQEISRALECDPVVVDPHPDLPVDRKRCFWSNMMSMKRTTPFKVEIEELDDILPEHRTANVKVMKTLTTNLSSQRCGINQLFPINEDGKDVPLYITEMETLFGFTKSFTDGPNLSLTDRRKLLGKAFCVPVIVDLLNPLLELFWVRYDDIYFEHWRCM